MGGMNCCGGPPPQDMQTPRMDILTPRGSMLVDNNDAIFKVMKVAETMTPHQMMLIVKFQARIRGMICRKKLKASPKYKNLFKNHVDQEDNGQPTYLNDRVQEIKSQLGEFKYDLSDDPSLAELSLEFRPSKILLGRVKYDGQWIVGTNVRTGRGQLLWPDGSVYEGYWKDNKANGKGRLIHVDGSMYQGEWKDDSCHGKGIYYHLNGTKFDGQWQENAQHGYGVETWADGTKYEGQYDQGYKSGQGTFIWSDNSSFQGHFFENKIQGKGTYIWRDGRKYVGEWQNNKMHGSNATFTWPDGRKYQGDYSYDNKEGYGTFWWPNGKKYEGHWKGSKQDGEGTYTSENGKVRKGIWKQGKRVQWLEDNTTKIVFLENVLRATTAVLSDTTLLEKYKLELGGINVELAHIQYDHKPTLLFDDLYKMANMQASYGSAYSVARTVKGLMTANSQANELVYFASIGNDVDAGLIEKDFEQAGLKGMFHRSDKQTGRLAVLLNGEKSTLFADLSAAKDFSKDFMTSNLAALNDAKLVYTSGFFISSCYECLGEVSSVASTNGTPFVFNIADHVLLQFYPEVFLEIFGYADYIFATEFEVTKWAKGQSEETKSLEQICKDLVKLPKKNDKPRVVIITQNIINQNGRSILVGESEGGQVKTTMHKLKDLDGNPQNSFSLNEAFIGGFISQLAQAEKGARFGTILQECLEAADSGIAMAMKQ